MSVLTGVPPDSDDAYLAHLAYHDSLTDLPNRAQMAEWLGVSLPRASADGGSVVLLSIDLDRFKAVNDSFGHDAGDELLCQIARRLDALRRSTDLVLRTGGDEFSLLAALPAGIDANELVAAIGGRIASALQKPFTLAEAELCVEASVGASIYPADALDARALQRHAASAMYEAKQSGAGFALYRPGATKPVTRTSMAAALRHGLLAGELFLHYQPIYRLPDRELIGLEALARWRREDGELVGPEEFIPVAETTGLIHELGDWALETMCAQASQWQAIGLHPNFGVNVSPRQLERPGFVSEFAATVARAGLSPPRIIMELTEAAWTVQASRTLSAVEALTKAGFVLALDDFGAGYSSLSRLRRLPVDIIKIDRSFLAELPGDPQAAAIVEAILALATACGCDVVCEGVETEAQLDFLTARGCRLVQGFWLGVPQTAEEITELLIAELVAERRSDR